MQTPLAVPNSFRDTITELCNTTSSAGRERRPEAWLGSAFPHKPPSPPGTQLLAITLFDRLFEQPGLFTVTQLKEQYGWPTGVHAETFPFAPRCARARLPPSMWSSNFSPDPGPPGTPASPVVLPKKQPGPAAGSHSHALGEENRAAFY